MTEAAHSTRYQPPHTRPAVDAHPDTPARAPSYRLARYQGDPYRQLAAAVLLQATNDVRWYYQVGRPLDTQPLRVQEALAFLAYGLGSGKARGEKVGTLPGRGRRRQLVDVMLFHEASGQELLADFTEEQLAERIVRARTGSRRSTV
ncbi:MAG: hypothetical protein NTU93_01980 [Arthrobacter sp.]|nr:hypothetical protein [Arthrobacter sp.]